MNADQEFERVFRQVPPKVVEGPHRGQLRQELLGLMVSAAQGKEQTMSGWKLMRSSRWFKAAAACLVAAALIATGWGAEKVYEKVRKEYLVNIPGQHEARRVDYVIRTPDGKELKLGGTEGGDGWTVTAAGPGEQEAQQAIQRHEKEQKEKEALIKSKKYEFVKAEEIWGQEIYYYKFRLTNREAIFQFHYPLEKVDSWEDYLQKAQLHREERRKAITAAIAKGRFRLIDIDVIKEHMCRDAETGQMLSVMEIYSPIGEHMEHIAYVQFDPSAKWQGGYSTSWEDHLQAIKAGKRELLKGQVTNKYVYEVTLEDGSKAIFAYGGGEPLSKGEKTSATTRPAGG